MQPRCYLTMRSFLVSLNIISLFLIISGPTASASGGQTAAKKSSRPSAKQSQKAKTPAPDYFLLTGTVFREDGSAWSNLQIVLVPFDKETKQSQTQIGFSPDPETGFVEPTNPHARTDDQGRFSMKVPRVYLDKEAKETPFLIGRLELVRGSPQLIHLRKKGIDESMLLKVAADVRTLDAGEIW